MRFEFIDYTDPFFYVTYGLILLALVLLIVLLRLAFRRKPKAGYFLSEDGERVLYNDRSLYHIDLDGHTEVYSLLADGGLRRGTNILYHKDVKIVQVDDEDGVLVRNQTFEKLHVAVDFDGKNKITIGDKQFTKK